MVGRLEVNQQTLRNLSGQSPHSILQQRHLCMRLDTRCGGMSGIIFPAKPLIAWRRRHP